jgi:hypothetical protein
MKSLYYSQCQEELLSRFEKLRPDQHRLWGKMTVNQMICHISDQLRIALGDIPTRQTGGMLSNSLVKWLAIYVMPWAKEKHQAAPELLTSRPADWQTDRKNFQDLVARFAQRGANGQWSPHPQFGNLSGKDWGVLAYRHIDYHLRQFDA